MKIVPRTWFSTRSSGVGVGGVYKRHLVLAKDHLPVGFTYLWSAGNEGMERKWKLLQLVAVYKDYWKDPFFHSFLNHR